MDYLRTGNYAILFFCLPIPCGKLRMRRFRTFPYLTFNFYHYVVSLTYSTLAIYARIVLSLGLKTLLVADPLHRSCICI